MSVILLIYLLLSFSTSCAKNFRRGKFGAENFWRGKFGAENFWRKKFGAENFWRGKFGAKNSGAEFSGNVEEG